MTSTQPRRVVDLDALAAAIAGALEDPTYALNDDVAPDGWLRFHASVQPYNPTFAPDLHVVRATVALVSDGEDPIEGATGEVVEVVVRRATA